MPAFWLGLNWGRKTMHLTGDISQRPEYKWAVLTMNGLKMIFPPDIPASQTSYLSVRTLEILPSEGWHCVDLTPPVGQSDWVRGDLWGRQGVPAGRGSRGRLRRGNVCEPRSSCCGRQGGVSPGHPQLCSSRRVTFWNDDRGLHCEVEGVHATSHRRPDGRHRQHWINMELSWSTIHHPPPRPPSSLPSSPGCRTKLRGY